MTSQQKLSSKRSKWLGLPIALVSVCITLFIVEIAVRFLPPPYHSGGGVPPYHPQDTLYTCDKKLGWMGTPNFQGVVNHLGQLRQVNLNSLGMYDTEHVLEKPADTFRILVLGDSFVHATQVDEKQTAHQVLEEFLNSWPGKGSRRFEVISAGVVGWGTTQQLLFYREYGRRFAPDLVVLMFYLGNDFENNLPGSVMTLHGGFNCYTPYFVMCHDQLNPEPLPYAPGISDLREVCSPLHYALIKTAGMLYQYSRLYQQLDPLILAYYPRPLFGKDYKSSFLALYLPDDEPEEVEAWNRTEAVMIQLQQEVQQDKAQLAILLFGTEVFTRLSLLTGAQREAALKDNPIFAEIQPDRPNKFLAEFLDRRHIPFIDTTLPMIERQKQESDTPLYLYGDGHWTVEGNRVMGEMLGQWLIQNNLASN